MNKKDSYCKSKCQFYYSPSFVCNVADKVVGSSNPRCPMIHWFVAFEQELRERLAIIDFKVELNERLATEKRVIKELLGE